MGKNHTIPYVRAIQFSLLYILQLSIVVKSRQRARVIKSQTASSLGVEKPHRPMRKKRVAKRAATISTKLACLPVDISL